MLKVGNKIKIIASFDENLLINHKVYTVTDINEDNCPQVRMEDNNTIYLVMTKYENIQFDIELENILND